MSFAATWIDLDSVVLSEKVRPRKIANMQNLKKIIQMMLFTKQTHRLRAQTHGYQKGMGRDS